MKGAEMTRIFSHGSNTIGCTPLIRLNAIAQGLPATILVKMEFRNPLGSVKDRIALSMIETAEKMGLIKDDTLIVEPTSGNTGIGLAFVCAERNHQLTLTMPETMSLERRKLLTHLGAQLVLTPGSEGMKGAIQKAMEIVSNTPGAYMPDQFSNPANPEIHRKTTAEEIWLDTEGSVDVLVAGIVHDGGHLAGRACRASIAASRPARHPTPATVLEIALSRSHLATFTALKKKKSRRNGSRS